MRKGRKGYRMDEAVIRFYRRMLVENFPNAGEINHPSIFLEAVGQKMIDCGNTGNYMQIYLQVVDEKITELRYLCSCEPVANVAVEVLCTLMQGKALNELASIREETFYHFIGSHNEELCKKVQGLLELLDAGIKRYLAMTVDK
jgi:NifU-like protein involved in Fe-S cluster formation